MANARNVRADIAPRCMTRNALGRFLRRESDSWFLLANVPAFSRAALTAVQACTDQCYNPCMVYLPRYLKTQPNVGNIPYMDPMGNILIVSIGWRVTSTVWLECTHEIVTFPGRNQVAVFIENSFHVLVVHLWTHWISGQISRGKSLATAVGSGSEMFHLYITARAVMWPKLPYCYMLRAFSIRILVNFGNHWHIGQSVDLHKHSYRHSLSILRVLISREHCPKPKRTDGFVCTRCTRALLPVHGLTIKTREPQMQ